MLARIVELSVQRRGIVLAVWAIVFAIAVASAGHLSIDAVPDVTSPQVAVMVSAPGLSPQEIETYLTLPVERAMNGIPGLVDIRSISRTAISVVTIFFDDNTDVWFARQLVGERLKQVESEIPPGYGKPEMLPVSTGLGEIYEFYLTSKSRTPMELRTMLDWTVSTRLRSVPGVVEVNAMGGEAKQYQVVLDSRKLAGYRLSLRDIEQILERNNASVGGGYIEKNRESYVIRGDAQFKSLEDIENTVITSDADGTPVLVRNVAKVQIGPALRFGAVTKLGEGEIVAGTVMMLTGSNSRQVVAAVKKRLDEIRRELPADVQIVSYYDRAEFIGRMLHTVFVNLAEGAVLVAVTLFITLGTLRGALMAALAIPLSMSVAVIGMVRLGVTGNLMSLGAIDFGLLVDGAIVMLEVALVEIARRRAREAPDIAVAVAAAMTRVARAVAVSLTIILMVYLPLMALEGVEGRMFKPMAITVALALGGALAFSLTAFPALAAYLLRAGGHADEDAGVFGAARRLYARVLDVALARPGATVAGAVLALVGAGALATTLGAEFVPRLDEGELSLDVRRLPSISITEAQRLGTQVETVLGRFPEVVTVVTRTGRAEVATDPCGPDETAVRVKLRPKSEWTTAHDLDDLGVAMKTAIEGEVPATSVAITQPIEDRVNQLLAGSHSDVVIKVFGEDLSTLKDTADAIAVSLARVPGQADLRVQRVLGLPLIEVIPDRARLARYGIPADRVLEVIEASRVGRFAGTVFEGARRFDLRLFLPPAKLTTEDFGELFVDADDGQMVPLAQVATIKETEGPAVINRDSLERRVVVEANVRGRDLVGFVDEARARVDADVKLPPGVRIVWGGQFENFSRASARLGLVVPVALAIIFGMLFIMFGDWRYALAVFGGVPFSLVGGIAFLTLRGLPFSIPAAVGFIAVSGVAVLNGVILASEANRRIDRGEFGRRPIIESALAVLRPVLTTGLVATVGFIPMAISHAAGAEVQRPLATVVIGGILSSTLLELLVLPVLLWWIVGRAPPDTELEPAPDDGL